MKDGIIEVGTKRGKEFGFTPDKFDGWLWKNGNWITISYIESKQEGKGHLSTLFNTIWKKGYGIKVPTPFAQMREILLHYGFEETIEMTDAGICEMWIKKTNITKRRKNDK